MTLFLALALWLALPVPPPPGDEGPFARALTEWVTAERTAGRVLAPLATRTAGASSVAAFIDRTGGCVRGWVRVRVPSPEGSARPAPRPVAPEVEEYLGAACDAPAEPMNHFIRFIDAVARNDVPTLSEYVPSGAKFPIGRERGRNVTRSTHDRAAVQAKKAPFPACDPLEDAPLCDPVRPSGRVTCACRRAGRTVHYDFQVLEPREDGVQLLSILEKLP